MSRPNTRSYVKAEQKAEIAFLFVSALIVAFQSETGRTGFADDLRWAAGICRSAWREEQIWDGLVRVQRGHQRRTHLMYAAKMGDVERVRWLLARGAQTELRDSRGWTALNYAACVGVIVALIEMGVDINATSDDHTTPIQKAVQHGNSAAAVALIEAGAITALGVRGHTLICEASEDGQTIIVAALIAVGADNRRWFSHCLHIACQRGHLEIVNLFIAAGENINRPSTFVQWEGLTAFHMSITSDNVSIVNVLIAAGANINKPPSGDRWNGHTPLHLAITSGNLLIVRALIAAGADVNRKASPGTPSRSPLKHANTIVLEQKSAPLSAMQIIAVLKAAGAMP
jgi:ankyrin repeat protein